MKRTYKPSTFKLKKKYGFRFKLKYKTKVLNTKLLKKRTI